MDLLQLEHFLAVVEERTFTRAAERVGRTQPAISQSIKKLEDEIGAPLFARDLPDVSLTEAGKVVLEYARKMVRARDDAMRDVSALKTMKTGTLNIAAHESAAVYLLPGPLRSYLSRYPDVKVGIFRSRLTEIPRQVLDREVDLGFVKDEPGFRELKWVDVHMDEMILVAPPAHPLVGRGRVHVRDLGAEHFVLHHLCSSTEQMIRRLFEEHSTPCRVVAELWSFENIKTFVQAEVGLAIVPRVTVADELRDGKLAQIPLAELRIPRRTLMVYRDQGYLSEPARELIKIVRSFNWDGRVMPIKRRA
ncbi:MAG TPA: LysR family transcriptional regulator [Vicinamibacterales bacterium]|jgi:DNA-binding transcriptional LysR family regulator